jgi:hypothetical protein
MQQPDLLWLPTDHALLESPEYRPYFMQYAESQELFFRDYAAAHVKMSELGAKFGGDVVLLERRPVVAPPPDTPASLPKEEEKQEEEEEEEQEEEEQEQEEQEEEQKEQAKKPAPEIVPVSKAPVKGGLEGT